MKDVEYIRDKELDKLNEEFEHKLVEVLDEGEKVSFDQLNEILDLLDGQLFSNLEEKVAVAYWFNNDGMMTTAHFKLDIVGARPGSEEPTVTINGGSYHVLAELQTSRAFPITPGVFNKMTGEARRAMELFKENDVAAVEEPGTTKVDDLGYTG